MLVWNKYSKFDTANAKNDKPVLFLFSISAWLMTVAQLIVVFLICSSKLCVFVIKLISFASINLIVQTQLHSYSKAECVSGCNGAVQFNNQLQMRYS